MRGMNDLPVLYTFHIHFICVSLCVCLICIANSNIDLSHFQCNSTPQSNEKHNSKIKAVFQMILSYDATIWQIFYYRHSYARKTTMDLETSFFLLYKHDYMILTIRTLCACIILQVRLYGIYCYWINSTINGLNNKLC